MARKVRFRGVKHSPKRLESDILERSRNLANDPGLLRPKCAGDCRKCRFDKTFSSISRIEKYKTDADTMVKYAGKGGDDLFKAYCATVSLSAAGHIPYLATAKLGGEEVSFAQRGRVGNDKLIGAQYYNDPKIRLLLYNNFAKKKKLHMYSFDDDLVCSNMPKMPLDYLYDTFWDTPYEFKDDGLRCGHDSDGTLVIRIKSLNEEIRICNNCAKDVSTVSHIISRLIASDPVDDIEVSVEHKYHSASENGNEPIPKETVAKYMKGELTDAGVLSSVLKNKIGNLKQSDVATYIIKNRNYGSDMDSFLKDLKGTDVEKDALRAFLSGTGGRESVIIQSEKASEALTVLWREHHSEIIESYTNADIAKAFGDVTRMNPSQTVTDAHLKQISTDVISKLPSFGRMGTITKYADSYAKAVKVNGEPLLRAEMEKLQPKDNKSRALARAFMISVSGTPVTKCTAEEEEFADFLVPFVRQVLDADGEKYRETMNTLLSACGSGEKV